MPETGDDFVALIKAQLTKAANTVDEGFPGNAELTLDADGVPHLKRQPATDPPDGLAAFEQEIRNRMPERHLLDILKSTEHWSRYTRHFGPPSGSDPKLPHAVRTPEWSIAITSTLRLDPSTPVSTRRKTHPIPHPQPAKNSAGHYPAHHRTPNLLTAPCTVVELAIGIPMAVLPEPRQSSLKLCRRALFLSPYSIFAVLPAAAAKSAVHTIVHSMSQQCPTRSPLCHASHRAFTNRFAATQHKAPFPFVGNQLMNPG
jgi:hypothetical protein